MKKGKRYIIGVDLGGTKIAVGIVTEDGKILKKKKEKTKIQEGPGGIVNQMLNLTEDVSRGYLKDVKAIGIGAAGPLNTREGLLLCPPNLPNWENTQLISPFEKKFKVPTYLENDANAAALAELLFGAGKGCKNIVYLTISTGIGGGIIIDGKLYTGSNNNAGEVGHMAISKDGPLCGCGSYGCLEAFASGTAIARRSREYIIKEGVKTKILSVAKSVDEITAEDVFLAAKEGDSTAKFLVEEALNYLGIGIANICNIFNPEKVILGGGVTKVGNILFEKVKRIVNSRCFKPIAENVEILPAKLGDDVGIIGAAAVVLMRMGDENA